MSKDNLIRLNPNKKNDSNKEKNKEKKLKTLEDHPELMPKETLEKASQQIKTSSGKTNNQGQKPSGKREITSIQTQKRPGRYNIYIDGDYAFPVDENILIKHNLSKGKIISKDLQAELEKEDQFAKAYSRALNYLSYALRTEKQVRDDLIDKEFEDEVEGVIEKLKDQALINDLEYAKSYVRTAANINRKGPRLIQNELVTKGVSDLLIEDALEEYPEALQVENASHLIDKQFAKGKNKSQRQQEQKVKSYLFIKGYTSDIIDIAFNQVEPEMDEDEEYQSLVKQGDKAWKRYARKSQGYELIQKVKAFLYNKGFQGDMINHYIDQKNEGDDL